MSVLPSLGGPSDIWVLDLQRGSRTRVTFGGNNRHFPTWTRDGTHITSSDGVAAPNNVRSTSADGSGVVQSVLENAPRSFPTSWSPDGRVLALHTGGGAGPGTSASRDIVMWSVGTASPTPFVATPFEERGPTFSPNGRWVAFVSNKSGMNDVYARPFPGPGEEITISVGGGGEPVWGPSGRELFYRHEGKLLVVPLSEAAGTLHVGKPSVLFTDPYRLDISGSAGGVANYDVSPDGQHFVMVEPLSVGNGPPPSARVQIVLNWSEELKRLAPAK
jgi:Tol biopolymer transport system component